MKYAEKVSAHVTGNALRLLHCAALPANVCLLEPCGHSGALATLFCRRIPECVSWGNILTRTKWRGGLFLDCLIWNAHTFQSQMNTNSPTSLPHKKGNTHQTTHPTEKQGLSLFTCPFPYIQYHPPPNKTGIQPPLPPLPHYMGYT